MPAGKGAHDNRDDSGHDGQHDVVDRHEGFNGGVLDGDLAIDPGGRGHKGAHAKQGRVDEEEQEGLVVAQADAGGEPGTVVIHLQHAPAAGRAVVGAIGLARLALFAETELAVGLDGKRRGHGGGLGREGAVAIVVGGATRGGEDCGCVAPVEQEIEGDAEEGDESTWKRGCQRKDARGDPAERRSTHSAAAPFRSQKSGRLGRRRPM